MQELMLALAVVILFSWGCCTYNKKVALSLIFGISLIGITVWLVQGTNNVMQYYSNGSDWRTLSMLAKCLESEEKTRCIAVLQSTLEQDLESDDMSVMDSLRYNLEQIPISNSSAR